MDADSAGLIMLSWPVVAVALLFAVAICVAAVVLLARGTKRRRAHIRGQLASAPVQAKSLGNVTELLEQLAYQAFHDTLTGLGNRSLFHNQIEEALSHPQRQGKPTAVLLIDLDDFKGVNETLGHNAGDELLVAVSGRLRDCLRKPDTAARLGGDEFAVLLQELERTQEAELVAQRIARALERPFMVRASEVRVHASIGVALTRSDAAIPEVLLRNAEVAMYAAKTAGKDRVVVFKGGMGSAAVARHQLRGDLERALERGQILVHYQPIVHLETGEIVGTEALVRWRHPTRGLVSPEEFIPLAEETGLIHTLGAFVLRQACAQTVRWQEKYPRTPNLYVSVNFSARQLEKALFVEDVLAAIRETGLAASSVVAELTESIVVGDDPETIAKLHALQSGGIRVALDDFGTGFSSLSHLQRLPIDILKIAKPFVDELTDEGGGTFARAVVGFGSALRLTTIAEGIEKPEQIPPLRELGCLLAQGFYLSHPVAAEELDALLHTGGIERARLGNSDGGDQIVPLRKAT